MGPKLNVALNRPINNEFYVSNERISGTVQLELFRPSSIISLSVSIRGTSQTYVPMTNSDSLLLVTFGGRSIHTLVHQVQVVFPPENVRQAAKGSKKGFQVSPGSYSFDFEFLMPNWLKCMNDHGIKQAGFNRKEPYPRLPPSFNGDVTGAGLVDCENSFYKMGSVTYYIKASLVSGKMGFRWTPGHSMVDAYQALDFMPTPSNDGEHPLGLQSSVGPPQKFVSKKSFELSSDCSAKIEIKSQSLSRVFRMDYMFQPGCQKFDKVSLKLDRRPTRPLNVKVLQLKLHLIEIVNYLSQAQVNAMVGAIALVEMQLNRVLDTSRIRSAADGSFEWPLNLGDIPELARYRFNDSNILYCGNRLLSFTSCNIKRAFKFCLILKLEANGTVFETEVLTTICDIGYFSIEDHEELPTYEISDVPPIYSNQDQVTA
ncbi:LAME_0E07888g1_1 [Lachancea meyersii CBS 8951]|uniref:LAME_0E07888g1_1 n=1 Tax=Lachancea meyersii CBS 8951 TaxID=1266667 RepID=A0A1G4JIS2_9SACH|nr:LAME_0E07888g1_1 [Lachancea meyersii CBS 8951]